VSTALFPSNDDSHEQQEACKQTRKNPAAVQGGQTATPAREVALGVVPETQPVLAEKRLSMPNVDSIT
jgi:hypothetical protein